MKTLVWLTGVVLLGGCAQTAEQRATDATAAMAPAGQSAVKDDESQQNVVKVAVGSPDHKTLVTAVQTAELVDALSNVGPFTVFAPTDKAFAALPAGTVDDLLKPANRDKLTDILQYHVVVGVMELANLRDGQHLSMVNGGNTTISRKGDKVYVNGAEIVATVRASNGVVYVVDKVLLPS